MKRRTFIQNTALGTVLMSNGLFLSSCSDNNSGDTQTEETNTISSMSPDLNISLAQWSLHRSFKLQELDPVRFPTITQTTYNINAVEYVNGFYRDQAEDEAFWVQLNQQAVDQGVTNLLIMIDEEGDLGNPDNTARKQAVENHYKWVHAAKLLNCHSIRVNAFGQGDASAIKSALVDGLGQLASYAAQENIHVLIENHGLHTSNGAFIVDIIKTVGQSNLGTLPDFGNWCLTAQWGSTQVPCEEAYDIYQGVKDFLPYAKGVSAKSYDFNEQGEDTRIDYERMLKLVLESNFDGYIGIEYEGKKLSEHEGILATKALLERTWQKLT